MVLCRHNDKCVRLFVMCGRGQYDLVMFCKRKLRSQSITTLLIHKDDRGIEKSHNYQRQKCATKRFEPSICKSIFTTYVFHDLFRQQKNSPQTIFTCVSQLLLATGHYLFCERRILCRRYETSRSLVNISLPLWRTTHSLGSTSPSHSISSCSNTEPLRDGPD